MYTLAVLIARYLFVVYLITLAAGLFCYMKNKSAASVAVQRISVLLLHITAFFILLMHPKQTDSLKISIIAAETLVFVLVFMFVSGRKGNPAITNIVAFLSVIGIISLTRLDQDYAESQALFYGLTFLCAVITPYVMRFVKPADKLWMIYLLLGLGLCLAPTFFGTEHYGAKNWIYIGSFSFQPSEIVKLCLVFFLASLFRNGATLKRQLLSCGAVAALVLFLVLQKDLGGAMIFFFVFLIVLYSASGNWLLVLLAIAGTAAVMIAACNIFPEQFAHVLYRVDGWLAPLKNADTSGYQLSMSLFAILTYLPFGIGLTRGLASSIPFVEKDFIFASIAEEFGFIFAVGIIVMFSVLAVNGIKAAMRSGIGFKAILAVGLTAMLSVQAFVIIGANTGFLPVTGVTLPFVSYGGTSLFVSGIMIGVLQWVSSEAVPAGGSEVGLREEAEQ